MLSDSCNPIRDKQIKLRVTGEELAVIDYAALLLNKTRNDFIIKQAVFEAFNIIIDRRVFVLDDERYLMFLEQLEAPVQNVEGRKRLMDVNPEWK